MTSRAVFLDRDGTLLDEVGYLDRLERLKLYPWSIDAVRLLNRAGFRVIVITNQAGVARGIVEEQFVGEAHRHIDGKMEAGGARIDAYYYCPHHPDAPIAQYRRDCNCRKPKPGMVLQAARDFSLDLPQSFVVGDRWLDVQVGQAIGARAVLVRTGYGGLEATRPAAERPLGASVANLMEAVGWILLQERAVQAR
jgi:D-glycero-D-manno-heptose 1,7-bisphosphate phosphatase